MGIGVWVCEGCGAVYETIGPYMDCRDSHGGTCHPCPHGGTHGADPCRHCEQNTGRGRGPGLVSGARSEMSARDRTPDPGPGRDDQGEQK